MHFSPSLGFSLLSAVLPLAVSAVPHKFEVRAPTHGLQKRFDNAQLTWYDITTDTTACGGRYSSTDHVVALDGQQFNTGLCGKEIAITVNGKTVNAQIADDCPDCPFAGLDLTQGLFEEWADTSTGVLTGCWDFI